MVEDASSGKQPVDDERQINRIEQWLDRVEQKLGRILKCLMLMYLFTFDIDILFMQSNFSCKYFCMFSVQGTKGRAKIWCMISPKWWLHWRENLEIIVFLGWLKIYAWILYHRWGNFSLWRGKGRWKTIFRWYIFYKLIWYNVTDLQSRRCTCSRVQPTSLKL